MNNLLNKYLLFIALAFLALGMFFILTDNPFWAYIFLGAGIVLYTIEKRKSIKNFFTTGKANILDKCVVSLIYISFILFFIKDIFIRDSGRFNYLFLIVIIVLAMILKRNLLKNSFLKNSTHLEDSKHNDHITDKNRVKSLDKNMRIIVVVGLLVLSLSVFFMDMKSFNYLSILILAIMFVLIVIFEFKKKSIKKE